LIDSTISGDWFRPSGSWRSRLKADKPGKNLLDVRASHREYISEREFDVNSGVGVTSIAAEPTGNPGIGLLVKAQKRRRSLGR